MKNSLPALLAVGVFAADCGPVQQQIRDSQEISSAAQTSPPPQAPEEPEVIPAAKKSVKVCIEPIPADPDSYPTTQFERVFSASIQAQFEAWFEALEFLCPDLEKGKQYTVPAGYITTLPSEDPNTGAQCSTATFDPGLGCPVR